MHIIGTFSVKKIHLFLHPPLIYIQSLIINMHIFYTSVYILYYDFNFVVQIFPS